MSCSYLFKSGKKKGQSCLKPCENIHNIFCSKHTPDTTNSLQFLNPLDVLKYKFLHLDTTANNKSVILKKLQYIDTLSPTSTEYQKNLNWLNYSLNFPYNKIHKLSISIVSESIF